MPPKRKELEESLQRSEAGSNAASVLQTEPKIKKQKLEVMQELNPKPRNHATNGSATTSGLISDAGAADHLGRNLDANNITVATRSQDHPPGTPRGNGASIDRSVRDDTDVSDGGDVTVSVRGMKPHTSLAKRKRRKRRSDGVGILSPEHDEGAVRSTSVSKQPREMSKRAWKRNKRAARAAAEEKAPTTSSVAGAEDETLSAIDTTSQTCQPGQDSLAKSVTNLPAVAAKRKRRKHARNKQNESGADGVKLHHGNKAQNSFANMDEGEGRSLPKVRTLVAAEAVPEPGHISTITTTSRDVGKSDMALQTRNVDAEPTWNLSEASAGSFLDMPPIFSQDGQ